MEWKKLGKLFDPTGHVLPNGCTEFAQSPQALVFDTFVRIYFSTRKRDSADKYISHVAFIDMDKRFKKVLRISHHTVLPMGKLGCFDEHGIFPLNVARDRRKIWGYIGGWSRRKAVSVGTSIGLAISKDSGRTYKRVGDGPILTSSLHEPFLVGDPFVRKFGNIFHMWYIFGVRWILNAKNSSPERIYKIGHATSFDGISWKKDNRKSVTDKLGDNECQALPTVIDFNGKYHMFFCYRKAFDFRNNKSKSYRIGYAYSSDLNNWIRNDKEAGIGVSENGWDSDMMCYPHVFRCDGKIYLLYNGNDFGRHGFGLAVLENYE